MTRLDRFTSVADAGLDVDVAVSKQINIIKKQSNFFSRRRASTTTDFFADERNVWQMQDACVCYRRTRSLSLPNQTDGEEYRLINVNSAWRGRRSATRDVCLWHCG